MAEAYRDLGEIVSNLIYIRPIYRLPEILFEKISKDIIIPDKYIDRKSEALLASEYTFQKLGYLAKILGVKDIDKKEMLRIKIKPMIAEEIKNKFSIADKLIYNVIGRTYKDCWNETLLIKSKLPHIVVVMNPTTCFKKAEEVLYATKEWFDAYSIPEKTNIVMKPKLFA